MREKQMMIRELFDSKRAVTNIREVEALLENAEQLLAIYQHPQPYIQINAPGGTKFERNAPFPAEVFNQLNFSSLIRELLHSTITLTMNKRDLNLEALHLHYLDSKHSLLVDGTIGSSPKQQKQ